jgi:guanylate kinase
VTEKTKSNGFEPTPPLLSNEDRIKARAKAVQNRRARASLSADLAKGELSVPDVLIRAKSDDAIARMKVRDVFESLAGVGPNRATLLMEKFKISESRRVGGLGPQQRVALIKHFS